MKLYIKIQNEFWGENISLDSVDPAVMNCSALGIICKMAENGRPWIECIKVTASPILP